MLSPWNSRSIHTHTQDRCMNGDWLGTYCTQRLMGSLWTGSRGYAVNAGLKLAQRVTTSSIIQPHQTRTIPVVSAGTDRWSSMLHLGLYGFLVGRHSSIRDWCDIKTINDQYLPTTCFLTQCFNWGAKRVWFGANDYCFIIFKNETWRKKKDVTTSQYSTLMTQWVRDRHNQCTEFTFPIFMHLKMQYQSTSV